MREALFSIWVDRVDGARFLDLFAGSGAVGLEALSRGAEHAVFVESNRRAARVLLRNLDRTGLSRGAYELICEAVPAAVLRLAKSGQPFDLAFADPPYTWSLPPDFLAEVRRLLGPRSHFALERAAGSPLPADVEGLVRYDQRRYGGSVLLLYACA